MYALTVLLASCVDSEVVNDAVPEEIRIPRSLETEIENVEIGNEDVVLEASFSDRTGDRVDNVLISWESSNTSVAEIVENNKLRAISAGTTVLTASANIEGELFEETFTATIVEPEIVEPALRFISSLAETGTILTGETITLEAEYTDENKDVDTTVTFVWSSSNESVATINSDGELSALAVGTTVITVATEGIETTFELNVQDRVEPVVVIVTENTNIDSGTQLTLEAVFNDNTGQVNNNVSVVWNSSNTSIATINNNVLTGVAEGTVTVTASVTFESMTYTSSFEVTVNEVVLISASGQFGNANGYSTSGDVTVTLDGDKIVVTTAANFRAARASRVPMYLTNNPNSISGSVLLVAGNVNRQSGELRFEVDANGASPEDFRYIIQWCSSISTTVGIAELN